MTQRRLATVTTINGRRVPGNKARISVFDNALLYAEGLFETFLAVDDRVIFLEEHLDRLYQGARVIDLKIPVDRRTLATWMVRTVKAHRHRIKKLRLTVSGGEAERWVGRQGKPQVILSTSAHRLPNKPFRLTVSELKVDQESLFRRIKTISYAIHATAVKKAKKMRFDDALLLNRKNRIAEVTSANIFWVKRERIYTPPLSAGCLDGVTRKIAIKEADKLGMIVTERTQTLTELAEADEVFVSSSLKLVLGVSLIQHDRKRYRFPPGEITRLLSNTLRQQAGV